MTTPQTAPEFITIGRVLRPQGRHGELRIRIETDFPERFQAMQRVYLWDAAGQRREFTLLRAWPHQGCMVLQLEGIASIDEAAPWRGAEVQAPYAERQAPPAGHYYVSEIEGLEALVNGQRLGRVRWLEAIAGGAALLHIETPDGEMALVPFARAYVQKIAAGELHLQLPEGLIELNRGLPREPPHAI